MKGAGVMECCVTPGLATCEQGLEAGEKICEIIGGHPFPFGERQPAGHVTISGGVAAFPFDGGEPDPLLAAADRALYAAKRGGRNRALLPPVEHLSPDSGPVATTGEGADDRESVTA